MKHQRLGLYLLDTLCVLLFSLGSSLILFPAMGHEVGLGTQLLFILLILLLFSTGFIRLWLPFAVSAALLLLWVLFAPEEGFSSYIVGYFSWAFTGMLEGSVYATSFHYHLTYLLLLVPIVLFYWLIMQKLFSLWLLSLVSVALLIMQSILHYDALLLPFMILCGVLIICLPRTRLHTAGRLRAQLLALLFALPILLCSLWVGPAKDGEWTSESVQYFVHDVQDILEYYFGDLPELDIQSMRNSVWMPQGDRLGGDVELNTDVVLTIDNGFPFMLRGEVLDYYTGSAWYDTPEENYGNFRLDSLFWQSQRKKSYDLQLTQDDVPFLRQMTIVVDANIHNRDASRTVYLPYQTTELMSRHHDFYFNLQGETALGSSAIYSYTYEVDAQAWNPYTPVFDEYVLLLERMADTDADEQYEDIARLCLQVPDTMPDWVRELCDTLTPDNASPYRKVMELRDYLKNNCEYTLTPGTPDPEQDFVAYFLQEQKGYCVYYASALTMMCRLEGIPARYVTGYGMIRNSSTRKYEATQATGHAWTEVYLEHIGWLPVDALSQDVFRINSNIPDQPVQPSIPGTDDPLEDEQPTEDVTDVLLPKDPADNSNLLQLLWLLPAIILLVLLYRWGMTYYPRHYTRDYVQKHYPDPADAAEYYYTDLLRQLHLFGLQPDGGDTLLSLGERADRTLPEDLGVCISDVSHIMNRLRFGEYAPTYDEVKLMHETHDTIEKHLRKTLGFLGYFFRRFFIGLLLQIK